MLELDLLETSSARAVWSGPLPPHTAERLIADTHLAGVLARCLPNDGAAVRLDDLGVVEDADGRHIRVVVGAGAASYAKRFVPGHSLHDDAEVIVARLHAGKELPAGLYRFACRPPTAQATAGTTLRVRPLPRRLPCLAVRSLWESGLMALPRCLHPTLLLPRALAERLVHLGRSQPDVEVGAVLRLAPFLAAEAVPCRLTARVVDVVPLAHGTVGTRTRLRVTPEALAAVTRGADEGLGLAHSHPFGDEVEPHLLSSDDKAAATSFFWRPFAVQMIVDPRHEEPAAALAAFVWIDGALARVCIALTD